MRQLHSKQPLSFTDEALEPDKSATTATVESLPGSLQSAEAGPSKPTAAPVKRKYEVDQADLAFCKRVGALLDYLTKGWRAADTLQLRAEEIELRDRNSVLRASAGGKTHVCLTSTRTRWISSDRVGFWLPTKKRHVGKDQGVA